MVRFVQQDGPLAIDSKVDQHAPLRLLLLPGFSSIAVIGVRGTVVRLEFIFRFQENAVVLLTCIGISRRPSSDLPQVWKHRSLLVSVLKHHHTVGEGLVPTRVSEDQFGVITPGGHKTLPYRNMRIYQPFLPPSSVPAALRFA
jgi:hypothetical protein